MPSELQAFIAMRRFLEQFYERAGDDMQTLIADVTLEADGLPVDPAAWSDWLRCLDKARGEIAGGGR
ncbi:MAG: hypothetical protein HGA44_12150 [Cellulomonadaceae bacterium]|nr:hypothetical protein [Cellulomonadaceae bacterium]